MSTKKEQIHEVAVNARNYLDAHGLAKHTLRDNQGRVCLRGAIHYGGRNIAWIREIEELMGFAFKSAQAVSWNNAPERTKEEVLAKFDEVIAKTAPEPEDIQLQTPELVEV